MHLVHTAQQSWGFFFIRLLCQRPPRSFTHTHLQLKQIILTIYNLEHIGMWRLFIPGTRCSFLFSWEVVKCVIWGLVLCFDMPRNGSMIAILIPFLYLWTAWIDMMHMVTP